MVSTFEDGKGTGIIEGLPQLVTDEIGVELVDGAVIELVVGEILPDVGEVLLSGIEVVLLIGDVGEAGVGVEGFELLAGLLAEVVHFFVGCFGLIEMAEGVMGLA